MRLSKTIHRHASEESVGVSLKAFMVLDLLHERGAISQQELGDALCLDANTTVLLLHELEDEEQITRRRDRSDRRRHIIEMTDAGRAAYARAERGYASVEEAVLGTLDDEERARLRCLLSKALDGAAAPAVPVA